MALKAFCKYINNPMQFRTERTQGEANAIFKSPLLSHFSRNDAF